MIINMVVELPTSPFSSSRLDYYAN